MIAEGRVQDSPCFLEDPGHDSFAQGGAKKTTCFCFPDTSANQTPLQQNLNKLGAAAAGHVHQWTDRAEKVGEEWRSGWTANPEPSQSGT